MTKSKSQCIWPKYIFQIVTVMLSAHFYTSHKNSGAHNRACFSFFCTTPSAQHAYSSLTLHPYVTHAQNRKQCLCGLRLTSCLNRDSSMKSKLSIYSVRLGRFSVFYWESYARLNFGSASSALLCSQPWHCQSSCSAQS
jgi:hypothetical protein